MGGGAPLEGAIFGVMHSLSFSKKKKQ